MICSNYGKITQTDKRNNHLLSKILAHPLIIQQVLSKKNKNNKEITILNSNVNHVIQDIKMTIDEIMMTSTKQITVVVLQQLAFTVAVSFLLQQILQYLFIGTFQFSQTCKQILERVPSSLPLSSSLTFFKFDPCSIILKYFYY